MQGSVLSALHILTKTQSPLTAPKSGTSIISLEQMKKLRLQQGLVMCPKSVS